MLYFRREPPCLGGIVALDGKNGEVVWQHWARRPIFSVDCSADLTGDGVNDCLIGGKGGLLHVVNGHDGSLLWHLEEQLERQPSEVALDVYSAQYIPDIDNDGFIDVISAHTVSDISGNTVKGHLIIISGKVGRILRMIEMPGGSESYYAPQLLVQPDGKTIVLIGTGGTASHSWGGLHALSLNQLAGTDKIPFQTLVTSDSRGVMSPPALVDINQDGTEDIVVSLFNSTVVAVDGKTFNTLWNYTFPDSQTLSSPTPGYFNDDEVPDFLIKYQTGPDFPVYFYSQMNVLDGKTGLPLLDHPVIDSVGSQMGGLSLSVEGQGNDWFLYWTADCVGHEGSKTPFSFAKGSDIVAQSQADVCRLRFNSTMVAKLLAINQHINVPGHPIYSSDRRYSTEYNNSKLMIDEAGQYLASHPDFWNLFGAQEDLLKQTNRDAYTEDEVKPNDRQPVPYGNPTFKEDQTKVPLSGRGRSGKDREPDEVGEAGYSPMQMHQTGKHQKPYSSRPGSEMQDWRLDEASKSFGSLYEPRTSDNLDTDYEAPILSNVDPSLQMDGVLNRYLADGGNEQGGAPRPQSNFGNIFHEQRRSGRRRIKRSGMEKVRRLKKDMVKSFSGDINFLNVSDGSHMVPTGIYPITSTGTLAPAILGSGIDLVLVSYWIPPSDGVQILTEKDIECMKQGVARARAANDDSDQESLEMAVTAECLYQRFASMTAQDSSTPNDGRRLEPHPGFIPKVNLRATSSYKALNLRLGQLTVYRFNLQCKCRGEPESCAKILPFSQQSWPSFMGRDGKGYFYPK
ncbi:uncharacterized protein LOC117646805 isoform X2 [Thrips palmi]|nr:uncharacterized protein LOC117646805 isoform X2 [Thrips palmi]